MSSASKHYFLTAKDVGIDRHPLRGAGRQPAKSVPVLSRLMARLRPVKRRPLLESDDFIVDKDHIRLAQPGVLSAILSI